MVRVTEHLPSIGNALNPILSSPKATTNKTYRIPTKIQKKKKKQARKLYYNDVVIMKVLDEKLMASMKLAKYQGFRDTEPGN